MNNVVQNISEFLDKHNLKNSSETMLVAFSGGYDSMCLLDILLKANLNIIAIHLNHNWRGEESLNEEFNCKNFCKSCGVEFYSETLSSDIPKTETAARNARYLFFEKCAKKYNSKVVFTAHNANDNAETIIYRIAKGTAIDGLTGIAPVRGIFYRPLINTMRTEIENYCTENNLTPNIDSSNSNTKYNRNFIRHKILPSLEKINPNVISAINSLSEIAIEDCSYLDSVAKIIENDTVKYIKAHSSIQKRFIKNILVNSNLDYDRATIEKINKFILNNSTSKSGKVMSLSSKLELYVNNKIIKVIEKKTYINNDITDIKEEGFYNFGDKNFSIIPCQIQPAKYPKDNQYIAYIETDNINFTLRTRRDGDIFSPLGLNGHQKLKKYLNEKKIPQHKKDSLILLCKDNEILWVPGLGLSDKIKVKTKATHIIRLQEREYNE